LLGLNLKSTAAASCFLNKKKRKTLFPKFLFAVVLFAKSLVSTLKQVATVMVATGRIAAAAQTDTLCYHSTPHLPVRLVGNGATRVPENVPLVLIWTASTGWAKKWGQTHGHNSVKS